MKSQSSNTSKGKKLGKKIDFEFFAPSASKVELAGCFNNWNPDKSPLKKDRKGNWTISINLPAGRYEYRFRVDDTWQNDQRPVECVPNAFGTWNCVLEVHE